MKVLCVITLLYGTVSCNWSTMALKSLLLSRTKDTVEMGGHVGKLQLKNDSLGKLHTLLIQTFTEKSQAKEAK